MIERKRELQVIFKSRNGRADQHGVATWLDYCREPAPAEMNLEQAKVWASGLCDQLELREQCEFSYRIQQW